MVRGATEGWGANIVFEASGNERLDDDLQVVSVVRMRDVILFNEQKDRPQSGP